MWRNLLDGGNEFVAIISKLLFEVAGGGKNGDAIGESNGVEKFDGCLFRFDGMGFFEVNIIEIESHKALGRLNNAGWSCGGISGGRLVFYGSGVRCFGARSRRFDGKRGNDLRFAVIEKEEVFLFEVGDGLALRIANDNTHENQVDV